MKSWLNKSNVKTTALSVLLLLGSAMWVQVARTAYLSGKHRDQVVASCNTQTDSLYNEVTKANTAAVRLMRRVQDESCDDKCIESNMDSAQQYLHVVSTGMYGMSHTRCDNNYTSTEKGH